MSVDPLVIATWPFGVAACHAAYEVLRAGATAVQAVEVAANTTEDDPEVMSVGYGGLPNRDGVVELDAAIMDGRTHAAGAVAGLMGIPRPTSVARLVMERTPHCMLVGGNARRFALRHGHQDTDQNTDASRARYREWLEKQGAPDVAHFEGPFRSHDTIGICAVDSRGDVAAACTTSGLAWKLPGRVGDTPIIGSGLYADNEVGAAAATGNGDEIMKVCLSYRVVMEMERGRTAQEACEAAIRYLLRKRPGYQAHGAACIAVRKDGDYGAAATRDGFDPPNRAWIWAVGSSAGAFTREGSYVPE